MPITPVPPAPYMPRTLWKHEHTNNQQTASTAAPATQYISQADLPRQATPLIILGEAGMGKTTLFENLATQHPHSYTRLSAQGLINDKNPQHLEALKDPHKTLLIDALDEVSAINQKEALNQVLKKLGEIGNPCFMLTCRAIDWPHATASKRISEQYKQPPTVLHLAPFTPEQYGQLLPAEVITHFNNHGLSDLLGNPQTILLIAALVSHNAHSSTPSKPLPSTRFELYNTATKILLTEHNGCKNEQATPLSEQAALEAAGAICAWLILTGHEAINLNAPANIDSHKDIHFNEISSTRLPSKQLQLLLNTRLFKALSPQRFTYIHRSIGEFLGAQYLAQKANTPRKCHRLLALFDSHGIIPAHLRGLHAWLALAPQPHLVQAVIKQDPMGIIEYADTHGFNAHQANALLQAVENFPHDFLLIDRKKSYRAFIFLHESILEKVQTTINTPTANTDLRYFLIRAIAGLKLPESLNAILQQRIFDTAEQYMIRWHACETLFKSIPLESHKHILQTLAQQGQQNDTSCYIVLEQLNAQNYAQFDDQWITNLIMTYVTSPEHEDTIPDLLWLHQKNFPTHRLASMLDGLTAQLTPKGNAQLTAGEKRLIQLIFAWICRHMQEAPQQTTPEQILKWLKPPLEMADDFMPEVPTYQETQILDAQLQQHTALRQGIHRLIWIDNANDTGLQQFVEQARYLYALSFPSPEDVIALLQALDPNDHTDKRWQDLIKQINPYGQKWAAVREAAKPFAQHDEALLAWLHQFEQKEPTHPIYAKLIERQQQQQQEQQKAQQQAQQQLLNHMHQHLESICAGNDTKHLALAARTYLGDTTLEGTLESTLEDTTQNLDQQIPQWLGEPMDNAPVSQAIYQGFEAFIQKPLSRKLEEMAHNCIHHQQDDAVCIIKAALLQRLYKHQGLDDIPHEHLMAALFGVYQFADYFLHSQNNYVPLRTALEQALHTRGQLETAWRTFCEAIFQSESHILLGLNHIMRNPHDEALACKLAKEWLTHTPRLTLMQYQALIHRLLASQQWADVRAALPFITQNANTQEEHNYYGILQILLEGDTSDALAPSPSIKPYTFNAEVFDSMINFRPFLPHIPAQNISTLINALRPLGAVSSNNERPPLDFMIDGLSERTTPEAIQAMAQLLNAPEDDYTEDIQFLAHIQKQQYANTHYTPPSIAAIEAVLNDQPPTNNNDLQAFILEELKIVQAKIKHNDVDSWRGFYDDQHQPYKEERCRDYLIELLRQGEHTVEYSTENRAANDKRTDIICSIAQLKLPIEVKGQWHVDLWNAADTQLAAQYTNDWQALDEFGQGKGIYLVLWFGDDVDKKLKNPPRGQTAPQTAQELQEMLSQNSQAVQDGIVKVVVLDVYKPASSTTPKRKKTQGMKKNTSNPA